MSDLITDMDDNAEPITNDNGVMKWMFARFEQDKDKGIAHRLHMFGATGETIQALLGFPDFYHGGTFVWVIDLHWGVRIWMRVNKNDRSTIYEINRDATTRDRIQAMTLISIMLGVEHFVLS